MEYCTLTPQTSQVFTSYFDYDAEPPLTYAKLFDIMIAPVIFAMQKRHGRVVEYTVVSRGMGVNKSTMTCDMELYAHPLTLAECHQLKQLYKREMKFEKKHKEGMASF